MLGKRIDISKEGRWLNTERFSAQYARVTALTDTGSGPTAQLKFCIP